MTVTPTSIAKCMTYAQRNSPMIFSCFPIGLNRLKNALPECTFHALRARSVHLLLNTSHGPEMKKCKTAEEFEYFREIFIV